jgi:hypothetical protein
MLTQNCKISIFEKKNLPGKKPLISSKTTLVFLVCATLLLIGAMLLFAPIPQLQSYHDFADQRKWLGIPNTWNVLSNIPFALVGMWGLFLLCTRKVKFVDSREQWFWVAISIGFILTAMGSSYYHLEPNDSRLVWDRLGMTIVFMSLAAALIGERINIDIGLWLWPFLLAAGIYSVFLWRENGDLRFYLCIQAFTLMVILLMAFSLRSWDLAIVLIFYALAIVFEQLDHEIYRFSKETVSGHTLKHLAGAAAGAWLIRMIWKRKIGDGR